MFVYQLMFL